MFCLSSLITLVLCIVHIVLTRDVLDHWKKYEDYAATNKCYERGDICSCPGDEQTKFYGLFVP